MWQPVFELSKLRNSDDEMYSAICVKWAGDQFFGVGFVRIL